MGDIFICHSRRDHELVTLMNEVCANAGAKAREFEFNYAALGRIANEEIISIMRECSALFVLLGRNTLINIHTSNWIASEVGLAKGLGIPIWVIEDWYTPINFPVPFVDHYLRIIVGDPANRDPEYHHFLQELVKTYGARRARSGDISIQGMESLLCGQAGCQAVFAIHQPFEHINKCPVCAVNQEWKEHPEPLMSE